MTMTATDQNPLPLSRALRTARIPLLLAAIVYLAAMAYMGIHQRSFLYKIAPGWIEPRDHGLLRAERYETRAPDGTRLFGWWIPPQDEAKPVYLYFHGNSHGLDHRATRFRLMTADGSGLLAVSYRGYGGSEGRPSEVALHGDARHIYDDLTARHPAKRIVLFGESLGSGVAIELARTVPARAVILDSPYYSVLHRGQAEYPWLPVSWLLVDQFRSDMKIAEVRVPILIIHGAEDRLIPASDSEKLMKRGGGNIRRIVYSGIRHVVPYDQGPHRDVPAFLASF